MSTIDSRAESLAAIDYSEVDVVSVAQEWTPLYTALSMPWRTAQPDGTYSEAWLWETYWKNGHKLFFKEIWENTRLFQLNGAIANVGVTTFTFDSTDWLIPNAILSFKSTWEQVKVVSITNATQAVVVRSFGTTTGGAIADDATCYFISTSLPAGMASTDAVTVDAVEIDNEMQKIVTTVKQSDYVDYLYQNPNVNDKLGGYLKSQINEHGKRIELAMLLSQKKYDATLKQGTMEWINELVKRSGNYDDLSAGVTKANLVAALGKPFKYGNPQYRTAFCGATALDKVALLFEDRLNVGSIENSKLNFKSLSLPGWETIKFVRHRDMNTNTGLEWHMIVIDPTQIKVVYQTGRDLNGKTLTGKTQVIPNTSVSTYAEITVDIVTRLSLMNANARAHSLLKLA